MNEIANVPWPLYGLLLLLVLAGASRQWISDYLVKQVREHLELPAPAAPAPMVGRTHRSAGNIARVVWWVGWLIFVFRVLWVFPLERFVPKGTSAEPIVFPIVIFGGLLGAHLVRHATDRLVEVVIARQCEDCESARVAGTPASRCSRHAGEFADPHWGQRREERPLCTYCGSPQREDGLAFCGNCGLPYAK